jgi:hypothetical protein
VHLLLTPHPLRDYGVSLDAENLQEKGLTLTNHGTIIKGNIPTELNTIPIFDRPKFMDIYGRTPREHIETMNHIFDSIPSERLNNYATTVEEHFSATHEFTASEKEGFARVYGRNRNPKPFGPSWKPLAKCQLNKLPPNGTLIKVEDTTSGKTVFFDVLFVERKTGDEKHKTMKIQKMKKLKKLKN